jgi:predicted ArsR family transcriptional regulator
VKLTNDDLLLLLAYAGDAGLTVEELERRLGVAPREAKWRLRRLELRGLALRAGTRDRHGARGRPARVFVLAPALALAPAPKTTLPT